MLIECEPGRSAALISDLVAVLLTSRRGCQHPQLVDPWQPLPAPAVQPKQWLSTAMASPAGRGQRQAVQQAWCCGAGRVRVRGRSIRACAHLLASRCATQQGPPRALLSMQRSPRAAPETPRPIQARDKPQTSPRAALCAHPSGLPGCRGQTRSAGPGEAAPGPAAG